MPNGAKNWCFTINNPTDDDEQRLGELGEGDEVVYLVFGREQGESGTKHLQGYISFKKPKTLAHVKQQVSVRGHFEVRKGTHFQAAEYCKKDGDYEEFGETPVQQGKRTDIERFTDWVKAQPRKPATHAIIRDFPGLWVRYSKRLEDIVSALWVSPRLTDGSPRDGWQRDLVDRVGNEPDDRSIDFVVNPDGNAGKTWVAKYLVDEYPNDVQYLRIGKRDDLAYAIDPTKTIFIFDVPRGQMEFLQYSVLEMIKDRMVFSPKYTSMTKIIENKPHCIVLCNEEPDMGALTGDRYYIVNI